MSWPRMAAGAIATLAGAVVIAANAAVLPTAQAADVAYAVVGAVLVLGTAALGLLVARKRPGPVGPLLCGMALAAAVVVFSDTYTPARAYRPGLPELPPALVAVLVSGWVGLYLAVALLMLVFPDGRLLGPRWRWVVVALVAAALAIVVVMAVSPGPYDAPYAAVPHPFGDLPEPVANAVKGVLFPLLVVLLAAAVGSLWLRDRRGDATLRAQLTWFALPTAGLVLTVTLSWLGFLLGGTHDLAGIGLAVVYAGVPAATAVAVLRHDLYDVSRAASAAVVYAIASVLLLVVFTAASTALAVLVGRDSPVVAAAVTAAFALAVLPLRSRLRSWVDRGVYPLRYAVRGALVRLRDRSETGEDRPERLEAVLRTALSDPRLRVGLVVPGTPGFLDVAGHPLDASESSVPVVLSGRQIGFIHSRGPASPQLLREVAESVGLLVEVSRLRLEVSAALRDVELSRARLLRAGYEERRRLERDLHDGTQQRLVSLGMTLRLAQRHVETVDVGGLLDQSVAELATAVAELRHVAQGLRPSCLDDGLRPALTTLVESVPLPVELEVVTEPNVPDAVATTVYYVVSEAVANAVKHGDATRLQLRICQEGGLVRVAVRDDGRGVPPSVPVPAWPG